MPAQTSSRDHATQKPASQPRAPVRLTQPAIAPVVALARAVDNPQVAQAADILGLQRRYGNRAVQCLLTQRSIQARLNVGPADDPYEREADRVAEQVLAQPAPAAHRAQPAVQRAEEEDAPAVQTSALDPRSGFEASAAVENQVQALRGGGQPLPAEVRADLEPRFGADFSSVRVHTDGQAAQLNRQLSAQAFTHGPDIYVGEGKFAPESGAGRRLLAHELTHVVQQGAAPTGGAGVQRTSVIQRGLGDWLKKQKQKKLTAKYSKLKSKVATEQTGGPKAGAFKLSIALVAGSAVRSEASFKENGHSWVELEAVQPWESIAKTTEGQAIRATRPGTAEMLEKYGMTSIGFYPATGGKKAMSAGVPGKVLEPEKGVMLSATTASKTFMASADQIKKLVSYAQSKEKATYSFLRYNCTNFAVEALGAAGFAAAEFLGTVTTKLSTSPNKVYKRLYERAALGDKSVKVFKQLYQNQTGHVDADSAKALAGVQSDKPDLLSSTEDLARSGGFYAINQALLAHKLKKSKVSLNQLMSTGEIQPIDYRNLSGEELRLLQIMYRDTLVEKSGEIKPVISERQKQLEALELPLYSAKDGDVVQTLTGADVQPDGIQKAEDQDPANGADWLDIVVNERSGWGPYVVKKAEFEVFIKGLKA